MRVLQVVTHMNRGGLETMTSSVKSLEYSVSEKTRYVF